MNSQTVYLLQAVWDISEQKDRILEISGNSILLEIDRSLKGALDKRTIYISPQAKEAFRKIDVLKKRIERIQRPYDLMKLSEELEKLTRLIMNMQFRTLKTLLSESGPVRSELHILAWQLSDLAVSKLKTQSLYQLHRLRVLNSKAPVKYSEFVPPKENDPEEWLNYYLNNIQKYIDMMEDSDLDGRWAYERKSFVLNGLIFIDQFVKAVPSDEELSQPIGIAGIGSGDNGEFRVFGRGRITNLTPFDTPKSVFYDLSSVKDYSNLSEPNKDPAVILNSILHGAKYLLDPAVYFELLNQAIIANTFHERIRTGRCLYCGSPLHLNKCSQCGHVWNV